MLSILSRDFYHRDTVLVARELLGHVLWHCTHQGITAGSIVETEAYLQGDPACHANGGMTRRNRPMFGPPGYGYVYMIYGLHHCFNIVTNQEGIGEAVLIRALEPLEGIPLMQIRRAKENKKDLCRGPARLTQAMGIGMAHNGLDLIGGQLTVKEGERVLEKEIVVAKRIGIRRGVELPLRFYIQGNPYVSKF